jgi:hypothetical protein
MNKFTKESIKKYSKGLSGSRSGPGSTMAYTKAVREALKKFITEQDIKTIFDAPCGHGVWMCDVLSSLDVTYHGIDITPASIQIARETCGGENVLFEVGDIFEYEFPAADLFICRDFLLHCSLELGEQVVNKIKASGSRYVGFTSWPDQKSINKDIVGDYGCRPLNLDLSPYYMRNEVVRVPEEGGRHFVIYEL